MSTPGSPTTTHLRKLFRPISLIAIALSALLVFPAVSTPTSAQATTADAFKWTVSYGDTTHETAPGVDTTVVTPGTQYEALLQYDATKITPGSTTTINVPEGVFFPSAVPFDTSVIKSITPQGKDLVILFQDDPEQIQEGILRLFFQFTEPENKSELREVVWSIGETRASASVIVKAENDNFVPDFTNTHKKHNRETDPTNNSQKNWSNNWDAYIQRNAAGVVSVAPGIVNVSLPYSIVIDADTARTVELTDEISAYLSYDQESFSAKLTTWDAQGISQTVTDYDAQLPDPVFSAQSFTISNISLPPKSRLTINYTAKITDTVTNLNAITAELQASADKINEDNGGWYSVPFSNEAAVDGKTNPSEKHAARKYLSPLPRPNFGNVLKKFSTLKERTNIETEGPATQPTLTEKLEFDYTLEANLGAWANFSTTPKHALTGNVILTDTLPTQLSWNDGEFLTVATALGGFELRRVDASMTDADFIKDDQVGSYRVSTGSGMLSINLGKNTASTFVFTAGVTLNTLDGLQFKSPGTDKPQIETSASFLNRAYFHFNLPSDNTLNLSKPQNASNSASRPNTLDIPKKPGETVDDKSMFDKTVGTLPQITPGKRYEVPFTFKVAAGAAPDLRNVRIIDDINTEVFDVSDLERIKNSIFGSYNNVNGLTGADFSVAMVGEDLVFTPSTSFGATLPNGASFAAPAVLDKGLQFTVKIPVLDVVGKQTLDVSNSARIEASDTEMYTWFAEATSSATSYGSELEVSKRIYQGDGNWSTAVRAELDDNNVLAEDEFIYQIKMIPHGGFGGVATFTRVDQLPEDVEFLGFVTDANLDSGTVSNTNVTRVDMGANVQAQVNEARDSITISQAVGTKYTANEEAVLNFKVKIKSGFTPDAPIVNKVGNATATIIPSQGYPLIIQKKDSLREDQVITDRSARFTVTAPNGEALTEEAYVVNGQLMVADGLGGDRNIVVPVDPDNNDAVPAGQYTVTEQNAPRGYVADTETEITAVIRADGSTKPVTFYNTPMNLFAIGDYVWIDENRDGVQDSDESPLAGVTVALLNADETPVLDTSGKAITTTTNDAGNYVFDLLDAGTYKVRFTLTEDQAINFTFTSAVQGDDVKSDSDADKVTGTSGLITLNEQNTELVDGAKYRDGNVQALNGIDPTWDAGVVRKTYAIGDYVWIDRNSDGQQSEGELPLQHVGVELLNEDGNPAADIFGDPIPATSTDANGHYHFDQLPSGSYQVRFTLTDDQWEQYAFTTPGLLSTGTDSDAVPGDLGKQAFTKLVALNDSNPQLSLTYDADILATQGIDPTWDAGVVLRSVSAGDLVWLDNNRDGKQDDGEPGIPGVVLTIVGPDGLPVINVHGEEVGPQTTDGNGNYRFTDLPVLQEGESYQVRIDPEASLDALGGLIPTLPTQGGRDQDSANEFDNSLSLIEHGQHDGDLDFGFFIPLPEPVIDEATGLESTGWAPMPMLGVAFAALLLLGAGLFMLRNQRVKQ